MFFRGVAVAAAFTLFTGSASAHGCSRSYTVQEGDFCDKISAANNVSTFQLATLNPQIDSGCGNLMAGESLCLGTYDVDCNETYVVESGDICDKISAARGINTTMLVLNNPQIDEQCSNLYPGEVLCICDLVKVPEPKEVSPPPPTTENPTPENTQDEPEGDEDNDDEEGEDNGDDEDDEDDEECEED